MPKTQPATPSTVPQTRLERPQWLRSRALARRSVRAPLRHSATPGRHRAVAGVQDDGAAAVVGTAVKEVAAEADENVTGVAGKVWAALGTVDAENVKTDATAVASGSASGIKLVGGVAASALSAGIHAAKQANAGDDKEGDKENKDAKSA